MITAALILTLCTPGLAPSCADHETGIVMPMSACQGVQGQLAAIEWLMDHPAYEALILRGYKCMPGGEEAA